MAHSCHEDDREAADPTGVLHFFGGRPAGLPGGCDILRRHRDDSLTAGIDRTAEATIPLPFLVQLLRE